LRLWRALCWADLFFFIVEDPLLGRLELFGPASSLWLGPLVAAGTGDRVSPGAGGGTVGGLADDACAAAGNATPVLPNRRLIASGTAGRRPARAIRSSRLGAAIRTAGST
jgi:hypothetical protein